MASILMPLFSKKGCTNSTPLSLYIGREFVNIFEKFSQTYYTNDSPHSLHSRGTFFDNWIAAPENDMIARWNERSDAAWQGQGYKNQLGSAVLKNNRWLYGGCPIRKDNEHGICVATIPPCQRHERGNRPCNPTWKEWNAKNILFKRYWHYNGVPL